MGLPNIGPIELVMILGLVALVAAFVVGRVRARNRADAESPSLPPDFGDAIVVLRTHRSVGRDAAVRWYQRDVEAMVHRGYLPATQVWQPGHWGVLDFLAALILIPFGIGVIIALYFVITRPPGAMLVTYLRRDAAPAGPPHPSAGNA